MTISRICFLVGFTIATFTSSGPWVPAIYSLFAILLTIIWR